jgi:hypothetical protein
MIRLFPVLFDGAVALRLNFIADLSILVFDIGEKIVNTVCCFLRSGAIITSLVLITSHAACAQQPNTAAGSNDAGAVAQALRDVDIKMTNPDPEMRIGYFDTIVAEGNARKTERAIRIAVTGQDEGLRVLGFRAYVASTGSILFDIQLTAQEKQAVEAYNSRQSNAAMPEYLDALRRANGQVNVVFEHAPLNSVRGFVQVGIARRTEYSMRGERLTFTGESVFGGSGANCNWEIRPTKELKVLATVTCQNWPRQVQLVASMF